MKLFRIIPKSGQDVWVNPDNVTLVTVPAGEAVVHIHLVCGTRVDLSVDSHDEALLAADEVTDGLVGE